MKELHGCSCNDGWKAWIDTMPPNRDVLHVVGACTCPTLGYQLRLVPAKPPGINPEILILVVEAQAPSGVVGQQVTVYPLEYVEEHAHYRQVTIVPCGIDLDVKIAS